MEPRLAPQDGGGLPAAVDPHRAVDGDPHSARHVLTHTACWVRTSGPPRPGPGPREPVIAGRQRAAEHLRGPVRIDAEEPRMRGLHTLPRRIADTELNS
ncbi:hypothetical protein [Streptomyces sp. NBC_00386]|uniref:hypothetical protein n=1 Tax=Streptomyces sp. NBC_00386 TaxID=2975734 RepID=UPI003FCE8AF0